MEWPSPIPVTERLPEIKHDGASDVVLAHVAVADEDCEGFPYFWALCFMWPDKIWCGDHGTVIVWDNCKVTHWLPLPPPPVEAKQDVLIGAAPPHVFEAAKEILRQGE